jgi:hypothetical protein
MRSLRRTIVRTTVAGAIVFVARGALAVDPRTVRLTETDRYEVDVRAATYLRFFQRALLPGPAGATVSTDTLVPAYQYASLRAADLDTPWGKDALDVELSAWGGATMGDTNAERRVDGDLTLANVRHRFGPAYVRLGRQVVVGGAARFAQFDGVSAGAQTRFGLAGDAYAGFTVLPLWSQRPGYAQLGSAADTLLRSPDAIAPPSRAGTWLAGVRGHYLLGSRASVGVGLHEQRENSELSHRNLGIDAQATPADPVTISLQGVIDADHFRLADGRLWVDVYPTEKLSLSAQYLRADPALFLSRQSVLGVFATDSFDEIGGDATLRPSRAFAFGAGLYTQRFASSDRGARATVHGRATKGPVTVQLVLGRVADIANGYWSERVSLRWTGLSPVALTLEQYLYVYDEKIRDVSVSAVEAATAEWSVSRSVRLLLSASAVLSPYAALDAQTLLRLQADLESSKSGVVR